MSITSIHLESILYIRGFMKQFVIALSHRISPTFPIWMKYLYSYQMLRLNIYEVLFLSSTVFTNNKFKIISFVSSFF
jgi:hypothetical protein